jgi:3-oxo-5-alpha-steroid 4-dehydrogenase 3
MNITHYFVGVSFYVMTPLAAAAAANHHRNLNWMKFIGGVVWVIGMVIQHDSLVRLAVLRKGKVKEGKVDVPSGGWFEWVSCPHFFGELVIYTGLCAFEGFSNVYLNLVLLFCLLNQTLVALETHAWYIRKFKEYPKQRKAIIPYLL